jgi:amphi-Trp domain-containing protein
MQEETMSRKAKPKAAKPSKPKASGNGSIAVAELEGQEASKHDKLSVAFESSIAREEAVSYFETLVAGLKKGTLHLKQDLNEISLQPPAQLEVKVKATRKREKEKISFEISWRNPTTSELKISSE